MMAEVILRSAKVEDSEAILDLIKERIKEDNILDDMVITVEDLVRDGFKKSPPLYRCHVAEKNKEVIGMGLFYPVYSTWKGKSVRLEDFFVKSSFRQEIASKLFNEIVKICLSEGCSRIDTDVLPNSSSIKFFKEMGLEDVSQSENWHQFKLHKEQMLTLIS